MHKLKIKAKYIPLIVIIVLVILVVILKNSGLIFNVTGSVPVGIYYTESIKKDIKKGDIVTVKLPDGIQIFGVERGYLKDMNTYLLKEVIAVPGDTVEYDGYGIDIDDKTYPAPAHDYDGEKRKLSTYILSNPTKINKYWLYGDDNYNESWDSRYYGPVSRKCIIKKAIPVLVWK